VTDAAVPLGPDDLEACLELDRQALGGLWSATQWGTELEDPRRPCLGIRGSAALAALLREASAEGAQHATLEVAAGNIAAQALYAAAGFRTAGIRRAYYRNGDDALIQWLRLHDGVGVRITDHF
jgi:ribosomal-protein-alanine N-acetyltransferase